MTTVGKASTCPGECVHAITSIFCDHVIEEIQCGETYLRCCVSHHAYQHLLEGLNETSNETTTTNPTTLVQDTPVILDSEPNNETISIITDNHSGINVSSTIVVPLVESEPVTTTTSTPETTLPVDTLQKPSSPNETDFEKSFHNVSIVPCPVPCTNPSYNNYCLKPLAEASCEQPEESCCLEHESAIDAMTKNLIKLVQQSVALNETKNIGTELQAYASMQKGHDGPDASPIVTTTGSSLPACEGTCVVPLFSILCDEIDSSQYCPNGGSCCVNKEQTPTTTTEPPIGYCEGTCIPVILSGMCTKPFELILKTIQCGSGTICCVDKKEQDGSESGAQSSDNQNQDSNEQQGGSAPEKPMLFPNVQSLPTYIQEQLMARPMKHSHGPNILTNYGPSNTYAHSPPIPHMHNGPKGPSPGANSYPVMAGSNSKPNFYPQSGVDSNAVSSTNSKPFYWPSSNVDSVKDPPLPLPPPKNELVPPPPKQPELYACPGNCISSMFKFTCFGSSTTYAGFYCPKDGQLCCSPLVDIEKFEAYLASKAQSQKQAQQAQLPVIPKPLPPPIEAPIVASPGGMIPPPLLLKPQPVPVVEPEPDLGKLLSSSNMIIKSCFSRISKSLRCERSSTWFTSRWWN